MTMNINDLTIGQAKEIAKLVQCATGASSGNAAAATGTCTREEHHGKRVIVRSKDAGVLYGTLVKFDGTTVWLTDAVQMWKWKAAKGGTLIDCAEHGVVKCASKFSDKSSSVVVFGACAIIDVTKEAAVTIEAVSWA